MIVDIKEGTTGLVGSGGGIRSSVFAAMTHAMKDLYPSFFESLTMKNVASGSSAGGAFDLAGQGEEKWDIWSGPVTSQKFIPYSNTVKLWRAVTKRKPIMNLDFLIHDIFQEQYRLNAQAVYNANTILYVSVTNAETGEITFFSNKDDVDIFDLLKASKAINLPFVYGKTVALNGASYHDSGNSGNIKAGIRHLREIHGIDKIVAIDTATQNHNRFERFLVQRWLHSKSTLFQENYLREEQELAAYEVPEDVFLLRPQIDLGTLHNRPEDVHRAMEKAYGDVYENEGLQEFIETGVQNHRKF